MLFIVALESLAETIRKNDSIKGLQIYNIHKVSLYADDVSLVLADKSSCEHAFTIFKSFEEKCGLKINMSKTEGFSINCEPINIINIKWNPDKFKYLGIIFCRDISRALKLNLDRAVDIFKSSYKHGSIVSLLSLVRKLSLTHEL